MKFRALLAFAFVYLASLLHGANTPVLNPWLYGTGSLSGTLSISATGVLNGNGTIDATHLTLIGFPIGTGTVQSVTVSGLNGIGSFVLNPTTTPLVTLSLGAITPLSLSTSGAVWLTGLPTTSQSNVLYVNPATGSLSMGVPTGGGGSGNVASVSLSLGIGLTGGVVNPTTTPLISLSLSGTAPYPYVFNVLNYGASGVGTTTTGTVSSGSVTLTLVGSDYFQQGQGIFLLGAGGAQRSVADGVTTLNSVTVSSATIAFRGDDSGKKIIGSGIPAGDTIAYVISPTVAQLTASASAGATGVTFTLLKDLVTTVTTISGTTVTLAASAAYTLSGDLVQHDDTVAINAAIAAATTNSALATTYSGGTVYFPFTQTADATGIYRVNGAFNGTTNSLLTFPQLAWNYPPPIVKLIGETRGITKANKGVSQSGLFASPASGVLLSFENHPVATNSYASAVAPFAYSATTSFAGISVQTDNIYYLTEPNPTISGLNFHNITQARVGNDVYVMAAAGLAAWTQPTFTTSTGIIMPISFNDLLVSSGGAIVAGFYTGIQANENNVFDGGFITNCVNGIQFGSGEGTVWGYTRISSSNYYLVGPASGNIPIDLSVTMELVTNTLSWQKFVVGVYDPNNGLRGLLLDETAASTFSSATTTGAANLSITDLGLNMDTILAGGLKVTSAANPSGIISLTGGNGGGTLSPSLVSGSGGNGGWVLTDQGASVFSVSNSGPSTLVLYTGTTSTTSTNSLEIGRNPSFNGAQIVGQRNGAGNMDLVFYPVWSATNNTEGLRITQSTVAPATLTMAGPIFAGSWSVGNNTTMSSTSYIEEFISGSSGNAGGGGELLLGTSSHSYVMGTRTDTAGGVITSTTLSWFLFDQTNNQAIMEVNPTNDGLILWPTGGLQVQGTSTLSGLRAGATTLSSTLTVGGAITGSTTIAVPTGTFATGITVGTLTATGASTLGAGLTETGAVTITGSGTALTVTGGSLVQGLTATALTDSALTAGLAGTNGAGLFSTVTTLTTGSMTGTIQTISISGQPTLTQTMGGTLTIVGAGNVTATISGQVLTINGAGGGGGTVTGLTGSQGVLVTLSNSATPNIGLGAITPTSVVTGAGTFTSLTDSALSTAGFVTNNASGLLGSTTSIPIASIASGFVLTAGGSTAAGTTTFATLDVTTALNLTGTGSISGAVTFGSALTDSSSFQIYGTATHSGATYLTGSNTISGTTTDSAQFYASTLSGFPAATGVSNSAGQVLSISGGISNGASVGGLIDFLNTAAATNNTTSNPLSISAQLGYGTLTFANTATNIAIAGIPTNTQTDVAGVVTTISGAVGSGAGAGKSIVFRVPVTAASSSTSQALVDALTMASNGYTFANIGTATFVGPINTQTLSGTTATYTTNLADGALTTAGFVTNNTSGLLGSTTSIPIASIASGFVLTAGGSTVASTTTFATLDVTTALNLTGTGSVSGSVTFGSALTASSSLNVFGTLTQSGAATFSAATVISGAHTVSGALNFTGILTPAASTGFFLQINTTSGAITSSTNSAGGGGITQVTGGTGITVATTTSTPVVSIDQTALLTWTGATTHSSTVSVSRLQFTNTTNSIQIGTGALTTATTATSNIAIGTNALTLLTTGSYNTAIGQNALQTATTGYMNTAIGYQALNLLTTGHDNIAIGASSSYALTTGTYNIAMGWQSMSGITSGKFNIAIGYQADNANQTAADNIAIGEQALLTSNTSDNIGIGKAAGLRTNGAANVAIGSDAMFGSASNIASSGNVAIGYFALDGNGNGSGTRNDVNVAIGYQAMGNGPGGLTNSVAIGASASYNITNGSNTVALGYQALYSTTSGSNNVAVGYQSGYDLNVVSPAANKNYNTFVGYQSGRGGVTSTNTTVIGANVSLSSAQSGVILLGDGDGTTGGSGSFSSGSWSLSGGLSTGTLSAPGLATGAATYLVGTNTTSGVFNYQLIASDPRLKDIHAGPVYGLDALTAAVEHGLIINYDWKPGVADAQGGSHYGLNAAVAQQFAPTTIYSDSSPQHILAPDANAQTAWDKQAIYDLAQRVDQRDGSKGLLHATFALALAAFILALAAFIRTFRK